MTGDLDDIGRVLADLAGAVFARAGEAATADMTRVTAAYRRDVGQVAAREGTK